MSSEGAGARSQQLPDWQVFAEIVEATAEGRVLHFNGGQAATISADGSELIVLDVQNCTRSAIGLADDASAADYVSRSVRAPADREAAAKLAQHWGVAVPAHVQVSPSVRSGRSAGISK